MARIPSDSFLFDTHNVHWGPNWTDLRPTFVKRRNKGVGMFALQELSTPNVRRGIEEDLGLDLLFHPRQFGIAFDPDMWRLLRSRGGEVGPSYGKKGGGEQRAGFCLGVFDHRSTGFRLKVVSAHPPSGVQTGSGPSQVAPNRVRALKAIMRFLSRTADTGRDVDAFIAGLDDNVDESRQPGQWPFMSDEVTGLTQIQPPEATHGRRKIDPIFAKYLLVGDGDVYNSPSDHDGHGRRLFFQG